MLFFLANSLTDSCSSCLIAVSPTAMIGFFAFSIKVLASSNAVCSGNGIGCFLKLSNIFNGSTWSPSIFEGNPI